MDLKRSEAVASSAWESGPLALWCAGFQMANAWQRMWLDYLSRTQGLLGAALTTPAAAAAPERESSSGRIQAEPAKSTRANGEKSEAAALPPATEAARAPVAPLAAEPVSGTSMLAAQAKSLAKAVGSPRESVAAKHRSKAVTAADAQPAKQGVRSVDAKTAVVEAASKPLAKSSSRTRPAR